MGGTIIKLEKLGPKRQTQLLVIVLLIIFTSLFYRFPFWFPAVINWDESTFIIMAMSILDGFIPYTDYWDLKPPLAFLSLSAIMTVFGESILSVRVFGFICVSVSSVFVYLISRKFFDHLIATIPAFFCVPMMSIFWEGQATFTEHIAIPFILAATYLCIHSRNISLKKATTIGLLISLAAMVRLNLAYVSIPVGFIILYYSSRSSLIGRGLTGAVYALSGLIPILILVLYYLYIGNLVILYKSMISVPLSYATEQASIIWALGSFTYEFINPSGLLFISFKNLIFVMALLGGVILLWDLKKDKDHKKIKLLIFCLAVLFSVSASGATHRHYLLQLAPFIVIFSAFTLNIISHFKAVKYSIIGIVFAFLVVDSRAVFSEYQSMHARLQNNKPLRIGEAYWVTEKIDALNLCDYTIYAMSAHIVYFLLDKQPPTPLVTHPSNLTKEYLVKALHGDEATSLSEFQKIMFGQPTVVVKSINPWYLGNYPIFKNVVTTFLEHEYELADEEGNLQIYIRRDASKQQHLCK